MTSEKTSLSPSSPEKALGYLLRQAAGQHRLKVDRALGGLGVTAPQLLIMTLVEAEPGCSGADIARRSLLTTATVSVVVNRLVAAGTFRRAGHESHGKIQTLHLSADGRRLFERCQRAVLPIEAELRDGLDEASEAAVRAWLERALAG